MLPMKLKTSENFIYSESELNYDYYRYIYHSRYDSKDLIILRDFLIDIIILVRRPCPWYTKTFDNKTEFCEETTAVDVNKCLTQINLPVH